jgi:hypothetical protein
MQVIVYAAKSSEDRHGSIPTQLEDGRAMCEREGWEIIGEFSDEGFSAYSGNRGPELERAFAAADAAAAANGQVIAFVVHTLIASAVARASSQMTPMRWSRSGIASGASTCTCAACKTI